MAIQYPENWTGNRAAINITRAKNVITVASGNHKLFITVE